MVMLSVFGLFIFSANNPNPIQIDASPLIIGLRVMVSLMIRWKKILFKALT